MAAGGDGQEFSQSLNQAQHGGLQDIHDEKLLPYKCTEISYAQNQYSILVRESHPANVKIGKVLENKSRIGMKKNRARGNCFSGKMRL